MASGEAFVWGAGSGYMLGRGDTEADAMAPVRLTPLENREYVRISIGGQHAGALTRRCTTAILPVKIARVLKDKKKRLTTALPTKNARTKK
jgi:hypothetical protein